MLNVIKFAEKKGLEEGIAIGIEQGMEQGMERGMAQATQNLIIKLLLAKFKNLPDTYEEKVREQDEQSLNVIATKILEMKRLEELKDYLH